MLAYFVLLYAIFSIGLLLAYQATRLFPLYLLKCAWTTFTILAFVWVLAMSFGKSSEYIQHPAGPFAIFVGETSVQNGASVMRGGYAATLKEWIGTQPHWIVGALFIAWAAWGLLKSDVSAIKSHARRRGRLPFLVIATLALFYMLVRGCGWRDAGFFAAVTVPWLAIAISLPRLFRSAGGWLLIALVVIFALPLIPSIRHFDWSRYQYASENYHYAWVQGHIGTYFMNSLMVTLTTVSITTLFGAMAAYVLARRRFVGRGVVYGFIIGAIAVPGILIQVPLFLLIRDWGFKLHAEYQFSFMDSRLGLSIIYVSISLPFTIFVLTGFFRTLPGALGEAALIDGCGAWRTFTDIYLPLALPGIATTSIFNWLGVWNEFNLGMIFMSNPNFKTLPIGLYELESATTFTSAWAPMFAGIVLLCLPTFIIFIFLQERIVAGLSAGGLKG